MSVILCDHCRLSRRFRADARFTAGHLAPLLSSLAQLHTFEIETQIQYFAPLSVKLRRDEAEVGTAVLEEDLKAFVNTAGWNLGTPLAWPRATPCRSLTTVIRGLPPGTSVTMDPTLHFMLYVPSVENRPLRIQSGE